MPTKFGGAEILAKKLEEAKKYGSIENIWPLNDELRKREAAKNRLMVMLVDMVSKSGSWENKLPKEKFSAVEVLQEPPTALLESQEL